MVPRRKGGRQAHRCRRRRRRTRRAKDPRFPGTMGENASRKMKRIRCRNAVYQRLMSGDATLQLTEHESASLRRMAYGKATTTQASPRTNTPKKSFLMPQPFTSNELDCLNATQMPRSVAVAATKITYRCNFLASEICDASNDTDCGTRNA